VAPDGLGQLFSKRVDNVGFKPGIADIIGTSLVIFWGFLP